MALKALPPWLYRAVVAMCAFMVLWTAVLPASWRAGFWPSYVDEVLSTMDSGPTPADVLTKYKGQRLIVCLHQLPSILWSIGMPLQLSNSLRARFPRLHRWAGRVTGLAALTVAVGVVAIVWAGLTESLLGFWIFYIETAWFVFTLSKAVADARARRFASHRTWAIRHFAAGSWVIVQRLIIIAINVGQEMELLPVTSGTASVAVFCGASHVAAVITIVGAEVLLIKEGWWARGGAAVKSKAA